MFIFPLTFLQVSSMFLFPCIFSFNPFLSEQNEYFFKCYLSRSEGFLFRGFWTEKQLFPIPYSIKLPDAVASQETFFSFNNF